MLTMEDKQRSPAELRKIQFYIKEIKMGKKIHLQLMKNDRKEYAT